MILATASAGRGVFGFTHIAKLQQRSFSDYGFERLASKIAFMALIGTIVWLLRSRNIYSWIIFAVCLAMCVMWVLSLATL